MVQSFLISRFNLRASKNITIEHIQWSETKSTINAINVEILHPIKLKLLLSCVLVTSQQNL